MSDHANYSILLADDDIEDQEIFREAILQIAPDAHIHSLWNGAEAVEYLENCADGELPTLIVLDYKMPLLNASEVLGRIAGLRHLKQIPKVVWSTSRQQEHMDACLQRGALRYFAKPHNMADLHRLANEMLGICRHFGS
ncbi:response regulator [Chitinophaga lutea]